MRRLGLAMSNLHTTFEVSTIKLTRNTDMNDNAKCENSRFEPLFGGLRGYAQCSYIPRWKVHCRLPISDN